MSIFREYDIRGVVGRDLTGSIAYKIGFAFGGMLKERGASRITIGRDARLSSPELFSNLVSGLDRAGIKVVDIGICPTPLLYFSLFHPPGSALGGERVEGGVMITGSHNPADYNGFKLCIGQDTLYGEDLQRLRRRVEKEVGGEKLEAKDEGLKQEIIPLYQDYMKKQFGPVSKQARAKPIIVVLDSGNGTAGIVAPAIFRDLGCRVVELYSEPDGRFPNHHPDPTMPDNLHDLIAAVRAEKAAFGVGYDGDADRIGVVDDQGTILWGDQLMMLFAREILTQRPNATFVSEVKASQLLFDDIRKRGGTAIMWRTGHSLIKAKMKEENAALAGEMSGHLFFADRYFGYDDAIYASLRLLELVVRRGKPLSSLLSDLPRSHNTPEIRVDCPDDRKFAVVERLKEALKSSQFTVHGSQPRIRDLITVDGVRVVFEGGWGLIRASNTQPALVLRFEADSESKLSEIRAFLEGQLQAVLKP
jgi:phosphomannomutase/phosphoglucomutase